MPRLFNNQEEYEKLIKAHPYQYVIIIDDFVINVYSTKLVSEDEVRQYVKRAYYERFNKYLREMALHFDGDYVDISYGTVVMPAFDRIRRITGYLVGTLDRFNDGKRAEEAERVKHSVLHNSHQD